jgi:hypothetical protein
VGFGKLRDRDGRERRQLETIDAVIGRELAENVSQRVIAVELVVAVRRDHERRHTVEASGEEAKHVECRLIDPMKILEHEHGWTARPQLVQKRRTDLVRLCLTGNKLAQRTLRHVRHVE